MLALTNLTSLAKPGYLFRPHQIARRLWREIVHGRKREIKTVRLPWKLDIAVDIGELIGWNLYTRAIYETAVTEVLWRLAELGDTVVDAGANVGYMTSILGARVGKKGKIYCFEPHPEVFQLLQRNVRVWEATARCGSFLPYQIALGQREEVATLKVPPNFAQNKGTSWLEVTDNGAADSGMRVRVSALDDLIPQHETIGVIKLDVQGHELPVLKGMARILTERRVRNIVFEEEGEYPAATHAYLKTMGYYHFGIEQHFGGVRCIPEGRPYCDPISGSPPNYVATIDPEITMARLRSGDFGNRSVQRTSCGDDYDLLCQTVFGQMKQSRHIKSPATISAIETINWGHSRMRTSGSIHHQSGTILKFLASVSFVAFGRYRTNS